MPFCTHCSSPVQATDRFCGHCGQPAEETAAPPFTIPDGTIPDGAQTSVGAAQGQPALPYLLSPTRVLVMTVLSFGLYLFYWLYLTWRQYRDHSKTEAYPIWHALTLLVPVYGLFRVHTHIRSFRELMVSANVPTTLSAGWSVVLVMVSSGLEWAALQVSGGFGALLVEEAVAPAAARTATLLEVVSILLVAGLLLHIQSNLNRYWDSLGGQQPSRPGIAPGEVAFILLGVLLWLSTVAELLGFGTDTVPLSVPLTWLSPGR